MGGFSLAGPREERRRGSSIGKRLRWANATTWEVAHAFDWEIGRLRSIAFSPDGMLAAAGGDKGKIVVWDVDL
jgi:WD40 repeat protein